MVKKTDSDKIELFRKLNESEVKFRRLFEGSHDGVLILDANTGKITDSNPFIQMLLGYSKKEMLGKQVWQISPFKNIFANKQKFLELKKLGKVHYQDLPLETKSGKLAFVEFVSNVYSAGGKNVIQCNIRDITERKIIEDDLKEVYDKLNVINKERELFVSLLAHELRSPLIPIMGYIELMIDGKIGSLTGEQQEKLKICYRNAENLNLLIDDFLDLTRLDMHKVVLDIKNNDLVKITREISDNLKTLAKEHNARIFIQSPEKVMVQFDRLRMTQIITNIVKNAIIHNQKKAKNRIDIKIRYAGRYVLVSVKDNGEGIARNNIPLLFDRIARTENAVRSPTTGTGLGLIIIKGLVELHKGTLSVNSKFGFGSTFQFTIPRGK